VRRLTPLALAVLLAGPALTAPAQTFLFSTDPDKLVGDRVDIDVRPNQRAPRYLFLKNPGDEDRSYTVELRGPAGTTLLATGKVTFNRDLDAANNGYARVTFAKPAPPPAPPAAAPPPAAAAPPGAPAPKKEEPPPGVELVRTKVGDKELFQFTLRVFDEAGKPVVVAKRHLTQAVTVGVRKPGDYLAEPTVNAIVTGDVRQITADVKTTEKFAGPACPVGLDLPRQPALDVARLGPGTYRRVLTAAGQQVQLQAKDLPFASTQRGAVRFNIDADGYPRAYSYRVDFGLLSKNAALKTIEVPAVRLYPAAGTPDVFRYHVRPGSAFPVRVELDGPLPQNASVQLRVDRNGDGNFDPADEIVSLPGLRDERIWIEPASETGAILVSTLVTDWVRDIDTRSLQGEVVVYAAVVNSNGQVFVPSKETGPVQASLTLIVDNTPPERIDFAKLPEKHIKGTPLPVAIKVYDPEQTPVKKAAFYIGRPNEEGKAPEGAALIPATVDPKDPTIWRAELPLPPDRKGELVVSVQVDTIVGFGAYATQRVLLVDAPPPAGTITGVVTLGGRPQPNLVVLLADAEGKPKGSTKSGPKGEFTFEGVAPGVYTVASEKPDSVSKMAGAVPAQVKVGETTTVAIALSRPKPAPPK
jgi:hypothetical protein